MSEEPADDPDEIIVCRVTTWYYRRMGLLAAMFLGMGLYFFYDGKVGYPRDNEIAAKKEWFEDTVLSEYDAEKARGEAAAQEWVKQARVKDREDKPWISTPTLQEPRWNDYAAARNWPEKPKKHSVEEIEQQFYWGGAMLLGAVIAGVLVLWNHNKRLTGHPDHMILPNGTNVRFVNVFKVDKRKWDNKGFAYAHYREGEGRAAHRAVIDDLMYGGAGRVLDRLLSQFNGELIEKIPDDDEVVTEASAGEGTPPQNAP